MAIHSQGINLILFHELKKCYPEVPDGILTDYMKQHRNDKSRCIEALATESPKYLFGSAMPQATDPLNKSIQDLTLEQADACRRSDSASSGMSNSSSCSVSSSGISNSVQRPSSNPNVAQCVTSVNSEKVDNRVILSIEPQQLDPYVLPKNDPNQIPQIHCGAYRPSDIYNKNPSQGDAVHGHYITESHMFSNRHSPVSPQVPPSYGQSSPQFIRQHHPGENHSSQATIVLNKVGLAGRVSPERTVPIVPSTGQPNLLLPDSDLQLAQHNFHLDTATLALSHGTQSYKAPLFVKLLSAGPDGVQVHYKMNDIGLPVQNALPFVNDGYRNTSVNLVPSQIPSSTYIGQLYPADVLSSGTLPSGTSQGPSSHKAQMYRQYPPMQEHCMVPGHQGPVRSSSLENEPTNVVMNPSVERILQNPVQVMSPASSHSSLSSESSQLENQRMRSGSQEEQAYMQALNHHQKQRMEKLSQDLETHLKQLKKIQLEMSQMENYKLERQRSRSSSVPSIADAAKLREHNLRLEADIKIMTREIDMFNNGQTPLGILDPLEQQNFYKHMNTGQQGSIYTQPSATSPPRDVPPPLPPRIHQVPPPPPPQPPAGSGDSDGDGEQWSCSACTLFNHPALKQCECCEMPRTLPIAATCDGSNLNYAGS